MIVSKHLFAAALGLAACSAVTAEAQATGMSHSTATRTMPTYKRPSDKELRRVLTPLQFKITQHEGTESPFHNEYWNNHEAGIYVDIVSGEPLFSSLDKYDSGTGWPAFTKPIDAANIVTKNDHRLLMTRTEVRSKYGDSHLGHLFSDGPKPTGLRYCINSASMRFIPVSELVIQGYPQYVPLFAASPRK